MAVLGASRPGEQGTNSSSLQVADSLGSSALLAVTGAVLTATVGVGYLVTYAAVLGITAVAGLATGTLRPM